MSQSVRAELAQLTNELQSFLKVSKLPDDADGLGESAQALGVWARRLRSAIGQHFGAQRQEDFATQAANSRINIATALGRHIYTAKQAVAQEAKFYERYMQILDQILGPLRVEIQEEA